MEIDIVKAILEINPNAEVIVKGDDPVPSALTSYSWQGHYNKRAIATIK